MQKRHSAETIAEVVRLRSLGWTIEKIAKHLKISTGWTSKVCRDVDPEQVESKKVEDENSSTIEYNSNEPIKTLEEACERAKVDLKIWYVERWECSQWTVGMNVKGTGPVQTQQYRVKVFLKRILKKAIQEAVAAVYKEMKQHAPKYVKTRLKQKGAETLAVMCLFDAHFGKLAWRPEVGHDYNLRIAEGMFRNAVDDLMARCEHRTITKFCIPIGNDFFHIDNKQNTTLRGTPQDTDGRYAKIFKAGKLAVIWAIERMMQFADVDVVWVPGNHDPTISYHLAETIDSWFHKSGQVNVDVTPPIRKYYRWSNTLLGLTHGDTVKPEQLPNIMAVERSTDWAETKCREWLLGHRHRSQQWTTKGTDTHTGTVVRTIQALTGTDAWHHEQGYVNSQRAAEVLFYEKDFGYAGNLIVQARFE